MDLSGMAISVVAYNEPRHLQVTLDALSRVRNIADFPVTVYIDGVLPDSTRRDQEVVLQRFPSVRVEFSSSHLGIRENVVRAIRTPVENGASSVLYIEDDHIVRPDVLSVPLNDQTGCFFLSLSFYMSSQDSQYIPRGNVIRAQNAIRLIDWIDNRRYIGKPRPKSGKPIDENYMGHDLIFDVFLKEHGLCASHPAGYYLAHFGLFGTNLPRVAASADALSVERRMFNGEPCRWLDNILTILKQREYPVELRHRLWPGGFDYFNEVSTDTVGNF